MFIIGQHLYLLYVWIILHCEDKILSVSCKLCLLCSQENVYLFSVRSSVHQPVFLELDRSFDF